MSVRIVMGDCMTALAAMADNSVQCVITSPPYWGLRDYEVPGQIGLEPTLPEHLQRLVAVFREVRRVLAKDGTLWLNYGDAYAGSWGAQSRGELPGHKSTISDASIYVMPKGKLTGSTKRTPGLKSKDRMMLPARLAIALCDDGWWLRDEIVWHKPNPMPSSVKDRTTPAHEMLYLLSKSRRYHYDAAAIAEPFSEASIARLSQKSIMEQTGGAKQDEFDALGLNERGGSRRPNEIVQGLSQKIKRKPAGWDTGDGSRDPAAYAASSRKRRPKEQAFGLDDPTPKRDIPHGSLRNSFARETKATAGTHGQKPQHRPDREPKSYDGWEGERRNKRSVWTIPTEAFPEAHFATFPTALVEPCILAGCPRGGTVLDPFGGSGTVAVVAERLQRHSVLIELNPKYAEIARNRVLADSAGPLLRAEVEIV